MADSRSLASLGEEVDQLAALVDDLQTLALSDAGALDLQRKPVDLTALVQQAAEPFGERFAARDISVELKLPSALEITGDAQRLRQLLHNLLENNVRYVESGGWVKIRLETSSEGVKLSFEDSGPGVPAGQLERLFERFYRVEPGRSRVAGGSGLGLSICRNIAEAHGGSIAAEHSASGGLLVIVWLPL